jgi:hypothetical protein
LDTEFPICLYYSLRGERGREGKNQTGPRSQILFSLVAISVATSHFPFSFGNSPIIAEVSQHVLGLRVVQLFYHVNTGGFLLALGNGTAGSWP